MIDGDCLLWQLAPPLLFSLAAQFLLLLAALLLFSGKKKHLRPVPLFTFPAALLFQSQLGCPSPGIFLFRLFKRRSIFFRLSSPCFFFFSTKSLALRAQSLIFQRVQAVRFLFSLAPTAP